MSSDHKKTVAIDFDGVIHSYTTPFIDATTIPDLPVKGIRETINKLRNLGFKVVVLSSRARIYPGKIAIKKYLDKYNIQVDDITSEKIPALIYVDDRGYKFDGNSKNIINVVLGFKTWQEQ